MKPIYLFLTFLLFDGCAKRQLDNTAKEVGVPTEIQSGDLRFTYEVKDEFSTEYFGMVGFVLENNTNTWMTVDSIEVTSDSVQRSNIAIIGGEDVNTWFASMNKAKQIESINKQKLWGTISFVSALGGALSKDEQVKRAAKVTAVTGGVLMTLERYNMVKNQIDLLDYFPDDHLMRTPFRIPPGLGVDKWMVINSQVNDKNLVTRSVKLKMYFNDGTAREYTLDLINVTRLLSYSDKWQQRLIRSKFVPEKKR